MTKLELLSAFLTERLAAAAEEILGAVKEAVREYQDQFQGEVLRSREENERLRRLLNVAIQRLLAQSDSSSLPAEGDSRRWEDECRTRLELPQVKEEPRLGPGEFTDAVTPPEESSSSSIRVHPDPAPRESPRESPRGSPPPPEVKAESPGGPAPPEQQLAISFCSSVVISDSKPGAPKPGTPVRIPVRTPRPPRPPRACPPPPGQGLQRWHSCRECGKGFSFACQLEVHMRWHTKEKPYGCAVCRKNFTTVSMLKRHHRIHTGEKPFGCHVCGKRFNQSAHLNTHFRLHTRERAGWARK